MGTAYWQRGDYVRNARCDEAALIIYQELNDKVCIIRALQNMAISASDQGNIERAISLYENCLALHKELEEVKANTSAVSLYGTYNSLGVLMLHEGQLDLAEEFFKLALDLFPEILVPTKTRFS